MPNCSQHVVVACVVTVLPACDAVATAMVLTLVEAVATRVMAVHVDAALPASVSVAHRQGAAANLGAPSM